MGLQFNHKSCQLFVEIWRNGYNLQGEGAVGIFGASVDPRNKGCIAAQILSSESAQ